jgi:hypothetical protein
MSRGLTVWEFGIVTVVLVICMFGVFAKIERDNREKEKLAAEDTRTEEQKQLDQRGIKLVGALSGCQLYQYPTNTAMHYFTVCPCQGVKP